MQKPVTLFGAPGLAVALSLALACYANPRIRLNNKEALSDCDSGEGSHRSRKNGSLASGIAVSSPPAPEVFGPLFACESC